MIRYDMMKAIARKLPEGVKLHVRVALSGRHNHCDCYSVTADGYTYEGHKWLYKSDGNLRMLYKAVVIDLESQC